MKKWTQTIILFDLDGTLTDSAEGVIRSLQHMQEKMGMEKWAAADLTFAVGPPLMKTFREDFGMDAETAERALSVFRERYMTVGLFENKVYPGIEEMLQSLQKKGKRMAVATSKKEETAVRILEHFGIAKYFEVIGGDNRAAGRDDKAKVIAYVLEQMNAAQDDVVMVGDRKFDIEGAHAIGIPCIAVEYGYGDRAEFEAHGADCIAATAAEVAELFQSNIVGKEVKNMLEIKGKIGTALCYAKIIEDEAIAQISRMCDYALTEGSRIRIMPDVHAGTGCTIGTTMTVTDKVCPNIVGVDIGCGMYTVHLAERALDFEKIDAVCHEIPSGMRVWEGRVERFPLDELRCYRSLKDTKRLERSLGTLGGGNHFIEIERATDGSHYLVIHSGSRNLGKQVAEIYQRLAIDLHMGKEEYFRQKDALIRAYKTAGRRGEIQSALKALQTAYETKELDAPEDLCWLYGSFLEDYLHDVEICQRFARRNREKMAEILLEKADLTAINAFHTIHNYIDTKEGILRKGAIAAHAGERVLIPVNMRDGSILAVGKGNPEWNFSAPHGAGRLMSRGKARANLDLQTYRAEMQGIYTTSVNADTLDEAPMAYKSLGDILDVIGETVEVLDVMKPVYNFKASNEKPLF